LAVLASLLAAAPAALAQTGPSRQSAPPPAERLDVYSPYERQTIAETFARMGFVRDDAPEGKTVERVETVRLDVFEPRDIVPQWLNAVEFKTREHVIRDEVLVREGDPYRQALVDDTIRNLRRAPSVPQLSLVLAVAAAGSAPDRVVLVVIVKDVNNWRANWDLVGTPGGVELFALEPAQTNFLGTHQIPSAHFIYLPLTYTFGGSYLVPRLGRSRIAVAPSVDVMVNRQGHLEGTYGQLVAGAPLYSGTAQWAWDSTVAWQDRILRLYQDAQLGEYSDPATHQTIPTQYRARTFIANYALTRSFGWDINHDFTVAASVSRGVYQNQFPGADPKTAADFVAKYVPVSDTRVGPYVQYHSYAMRFVRVFDFDTLALQEDYRLGHDIVLRVRPAPRAFGSTRDVLGFYGAAQYTWAMRDGLARISLQATLDREPDRISDAAIEPTAHLVTPTIAGLGRIVLDSSLVWRPRNYLNVTTTLGGSDRLRGFPTNFFVGADTVSYNVEFRSRPVEIATLELAGVAFFDVGHAFTGWDQFIPYQSAGFGIRALFPWLDRTVFQADLGFPFEHPLDSRGSPIAPFSYVISFGQAFVTPTVAPTPVLPTGQGPDSP
jgi:hypothetical protein